MANIGRMANADRMSNKDRMANRDRMANKDRIANTVSSRYLEVKVHLKLLISRSKFSGSRNFFL